MWGVREDKVLCDAVSYSNKEDIFGVLKVVGDASEGDEKFGTTHVAYENAANIGRVIGICFGGYGGWE
jgi:hypothetical protein